MAVRAGLSATVSKGLPAVNYTRDELLYLPRNVRSHSLYGFSPVEQEHRAFCDHTGSYGIISGRLKIIEAFVRAVEVAYVSDGIPKPLDRSLCAFSKMGFEL